MPSKLDYRAIDRKLDVVFVEIEETPDHVPFAPRFSEVDGTVVPKLAPFAVAAIGKRVVADASRGIRPEALPCPADLGAQYSAFAHRDLIAPPTGRKTERRQPDGREDLILFSHSPHPVIIV